VVRGNLPLALAAFVMMIDGISRMSAVQKIANPDLDLELHSGIKTGQAHGAAR